MVKMRDMPKFVVGNDYGVDIPLNYIESWIRRHEEDCGVDIDPDFQRGHVWNDDQRSKFMEFMFKGGRSARYIYWNCPNYTHKSNEKGDLKEELLLVDGKQRLTAALMFMHDALPVFGHYRDEFEDAKIYTGMGGPLFHFAVNNLVWRRDLLRWYVEMNENGTPHTTEELERVHKLLRESNGI